MNINLTEDFQKAGEQQQEKDICKVTFLPMNRTVKVPKGSTLLDIALNHEIDLEHNCGGNCACSTCHVIIKQGMEYLTPKSEDEEDQLDEADGLTLSSRLACQAKISGDIMVEIPETSQPFRAGGH
jgi:ferredoxin, 2Fe-2S